MYDTWRALGLSEAAALAEVTRLGLAGDGDRFDEVVGLAGGLGLSETEAQAFAVGRDGTEYAAREAWAQPPAAPAGASVAGLSEAERTTLDAGLRKAFGMAVGNAVTFGRMTEAAAVRHVMSQMIVKTYEVARALTGTPTPAPAVEARSPRPPAHGMPLTEPQGRARGGAR